MFPFLPDRVVTILWEKKEIRNLQMSLAGASLLLASSALGHIFSEDLIVYDFAVAIGAVDWNVIILIMGMMIVIAVVGRWVSTFQPGIYCLLNGPILCTW
jgi:hypothetical protein